MAKPAAEFDLPLDFVQGLLRSQHPDLADLHMTEVASGWDNAIFRLGDSLAIRLPRRLAAAKLIKHEQQWLPRLQGRLPVPVPAPIRVGSPQRGYPCSWSITAWIEGETADNAPPDPNQGVALAAFLEALHTKPPARAPRNPYRGVPLMQRSTTFSRCISALARRGWVLDDRLLPLWRTALEAPVDAPPAWIHGDLHSRNVLVANGRISGVIDWGDLAQGDRATDLAANWILFPQADSREQVMTACRSVSANTWRRARGWALLLAIVVLESADPAHITAAERTLRRLLDGP